MTAKIQARGLERRDSLLPIPRLTPRAFMGSVSDGMPCQRTPAWPQPLPCLSGHEA